MRAAFERFASGRPGRLTIAVMPSSGSQPVLLGDDGAFHAWSTIKVAVLAGLLTVVHRDALMPEHLDLATRAITESDNSAVLELFLLLEGLAGGSSQAGLVIERLFSLSGDDRSRVVLAPPPPGAVTPFGQTGWSAGESARFFAALAAQRLLSAADTRYLLDLMERIIPEQRWGLGRLGRPVAFKGGWGPEDDGSCLVRQSGVLLEGGQAISLVVQPPPGEASFQQGVRMIDQAAAWIAELIDPGA